MDMYIVSGTLGGKGFHSTITQGNARWEIVNGVMIPDAHGEYDGKRDQETQFSAHYWK